MSIIVVRERAYVTKRHDGVYEYDGMYMRGRLLIVNRRDPSAEKIISMSGSPYKA